MISDQVDFTDYYFIGMAIFFVMANTKTFKNILKFGCHKL
jgi:hypothetical protein